jgi:hypothetical protein
LLPNAVASFLTPSPAPSDYPKTLLDVLRVEDVEGLIKLHIALGKCLATTYDVAGSVASYQAALKVCCGALCYPTNA